MENLRNCLKDVKTWIELNFLGLNKNKTKVNEFGITDVLIGFISAVGSLDQTVTFLGVLGLF